MRNATGYMFTTLPGRSDRASLQLGGNVAEDECRVLSAVTRANFEYPSLLYTKQTLFKGMPYPARLAKGGKTRRKMARIATQKGIFQRVKDALLLNG